MNTKPIFNLKSAIAPDTPTEALLFDLPDTDYVDYGEDDATMWLEGRANATLADVRQEQVGEIACIIVDLLRSCDSPATYDVAMLLRELLDYEAAFDVVLERAIKLALAPMRGVH